MKVAENKTKYQKGYPIGHRFDNSKIQNRIASNNEKTGNSQSTWRKRRIFPFPAVEPAKVGYPEKLRGSACDFPAHLRSDRRIRKSQLAPKHRHLYSYFPTDNDPGPLPVRYFPGFRRRSRPWHTLSLSLSRRSLLLLYNDNFVLWRRWWPICGSFRIRGASAPTRLHAFRICCR